jgi:alpha-ketoglutarate-dependent taurine dioxygenase
MVIPFDIRGQELYYNFQELLNNIVPFHSINLKSGEALIINNNKALHKTLLDVAG